MLTFTSVQHRGLVFSIKIVPIHILRPPNTCKCEHGVFPFKEAFRVLGMAVTFAARVSRSSLYKPINPFWFLSACVLLCATDLAGSLVLSLCCDVVVIGKFVCVDISCLLGFLIRLMRTILYPEVETPWRYMFNELL